MDLTRAEGDPTERKTDEMEASVCGCRLLVKGADPYHLRGDRELRDLGFLASDHRVSEAAHGLKPFTTLSGEQGFTKSDAVRGSV